MLQFCPCLVTTSKFLGCFCPLIGQLAPLIFWGKEIRALIILFFSVSQQPKNALLETT